MWLTSLLFTRPWGSERHGPGRGPRLGAPDPQRRASRPRLEVLEGRALLSSWTVTSAAADGTSGTLRSTIAAAVSGDTIQFSDQHAARPSLEPCESRQLLSHSGVPPAEKTLYVWAGDGDQKDPDFLAVVNFDQRSPDYGHVIRTVPLPPPGDTGNEPHHMGLSADGKVLGAGGLLSLLKGQNSLFFFDVSKARQPQLKFSTNAQLSSVTDDFFPLPGGGFLVTQMGSINGGTPGRVDEFDRNLNLVHEWPDNPPQDGFNPHGISVRPEENLMVTSDFIDPASSLNVTSGPLIARGSIRVWDFERREIVRTIFVPGPGPTLTGPGTMEVKLIPRDPQGRAYTNGMFDGKLYLLDTQAGTATEVFDYSTISPKTPSTPFPGGMPQLMEMTQDGKRLFVSLYMTGKVLMFDISHPAHPKLLSVVDLGPNAGPHYIFLTRDDKRLVVTDYFLDEKVDGQPPFGKVLFDGDRKVHVFQVMKDRLVLDTRFNLDFNTAFPDTGPARPHGVEAK